MYNRDSRIETKVGLFILTGFLVVAFLVVYFGRLGQGLRCPGDAAVALALDQAQLWSTEDNVVSIVEIIKGRVKSESGCCHGLILPEGCDTLEGLQTGCWQRKLLLQWWVAEDVWIYWSNT